MKSNHIPAIYKIRVKTILQTQKERKERKKK